MGKFLKILFLNFIFLCAPAFAQAENNNFSISDFKINKVNIEKVSANSGNKQVVSAESNNAVIKKQIPKLRLIANTEEKQKTLPVHEASPSTKPEISTSAVKDSTHESNSLAGGYAASESVQQSEPVSKAEKTLNQVQDDKNIVQDKASENDLNGKALENSDSKTVSKIDKINESSQSFDKIPIKKDTSGSYYLRALSALVIVLLLIFAFAWGYAKIKGINPSAILTGKFAEKNLNKFNILSSSTLGQGKDIHLVEINGKQLVIGSTASNINLLTEIEPEEIEKLKAKKHSENTPTETKTEDKLPQEDSIPEKEMPNENDEFADPDNYSSRYSDLYKDYNKE